MRGEQVFERVVAQQAVDHFGGFPAVAEPRPQRRAPGPRPRTPGVSGERAPFERDPRGFEEFGRLHGVDGAAGVDGEEVRGVAMVVALSVAVGLPISVYVPKTLSKEEKQAIEQFKGSDNFKGDKQTRDSIFQKFKNYFN